MCIYTNTVFVWNAIGTNACRSLFFVTLIHCEYSIGGGLTGWILVYSRNIRKYQLYHSQRFEALDTSLWYARNLYRGPPLNYSTAQFWASSNKLFILLDKKSEFGYHMEFLASSFPGDEARREEIQSWWVQSWLPRMRDQPAVPFHRHNATADHPPSLLTDMFDKIGHICSYVCIWLSLLWIDCGSWHKVHRNHHC